MFAEQQPALLYPKVSFQKVAWDYMVLINLGRQLFRLLRNLNTDIFGKEQSSKVYSKELLQCKMLCMTPLLTTFELFMDSNDMCASTLT